MELIFLRAQVFCCFDFCFQVVSSTYCFLLTGKKIQVCANGLLFFHMSHEEWEIQLVAESKLHHPYALFP